MAVSYERRRIIVVIDTGRACYREVIQGISFYGNYKGRWHLQNLSPETDFVRALRLCKPAGLLLGPIYDTDKLRKATRLVPQSVVVCGAGPEHNPLLTEVGPDEVAVGALGAGHLLSKGFRNYAFVGQPSFVASKGRWQGFKKELGKSGYVPEFYEIEWNWELNLPVDVSLRELTHWLIGLPKPLGIMAWNDATARILSGSCQDADIRVPDDIAILGVDNDDLDTAISNPPLSSVIIPWRLLGQTASALLDRIIDGEVLSPTYRSLPPQGIAERQSTGSIAIVDEQVRNAVRFIREHAGSHFTVNDVVEEVGTTRRALERKFRARLGRSPLEEIRRCRVDRAMHLLSQTQMTIKQVAHNSGFASVTWFTTAFREITGQSPADYRNHHRGR
jgi:LacI family transcriptional regulator